MKSIYRKSWLFIMFLSLCLILLPACEKKSTTEPDNTGELNNDITDISNYHTKANELVQNLYKATTTNEIQDVLKEICTILGLGVYDETKNTIVSGSGSPDDGGMYLWGFQLETLAECFLRNKENPTQYMPVDSLANLSKVGLYAESIIYGKTDLTPAVVREIITMYMFTYLVGMQGENLDRWYFMPHLIGALFQYSDNSYDFDNLEKLDPLQAFFIALDWTTEPLNSGIPKDSNVPDDTHITPLDKSNSISGYWGAARNLLGGASKIAGVIPIGEALSGIQGMIIAYGTKMRLEGPASMHYQHSSSGSGEQFQAYVEFLDDWGKYATTYAGIPQKGPMNDVYINFQLDQLTPAHGSISQKLGDWDLAFPYSLIWDAKTDADGKVGFIFLTKLEDPIGNFESFDRITISAEANPYSKTDWVQQVAVHMFPIFTYFYLDVSWHEKTHGF